jgi:hypothetical protein
MTRFLPSVNWLGAGREGASVEFGENDSLEMK